MEAKLTQVGEIIVVNINGRLDIDKTHPFKEACIKNLYDKKIVFNLQQLSFVGSTGIQSFFQALSEIHDKNKYGLRVAGMTSDFFRLWAAKQPTAVSVFENTSAAMLSFVEAVTPVAIPAPVQVSETPETPERTS